MASIALLSGVVVGMIATALVYADASRRNLTTRTQNLWTAGVGVVSIGSFVALSVLGDALFELYTRSTETTIVVQSPREIVVTLFSIGFSVSVIAVLAYGFGSRFGPLKSA